MSTDLEHFDSVCADRLIAERLRLRLSQDQAGETCGVSREMWGRYERAKASPGGDVLLRFQRAGADVQYILTGRKSVPALCVEQERAGYVVEVLSPAEAQALATLRASGVLGGVSVNISSNAGQAAGIIQGDMNGTGRSKRRPR